MGKTHFCINAASGKRLHATQDKQKEISAKHKYQCRKRQEVACNPTLYVFSLSSHPLRGRSLSVHTMSPGSLAAQGSKTGFWSRNDFFGHFYHFRTCAPVVFQNRNWLHPLPCNGFGHARTNRSGFCESAKFSRFCTQFTDIYILPEFHRFFNPFHKKTAAQLSLRGR